MVCVYGMARPLTVPARINRVVTLKRARSLALSHSARACPADSSRRARAAAAHRSRVRARKKDGEKFYPVEKVLLENHKAIYDSINVHRDRPKRSLRGIQE